VNFEDAKKYFLDALLEIHTANTLMLARQAIIPKAVASVLLEAISKLDRVGILAARYDGRSEDLFFYVQRLLVESCGKDAAGRIHTARSRRYRSHPVPYVPAPRNSKNIGGNNRSARRPARSCGVAPANANARLQGKPVAYTLLGLQHIC